MPSGWPPYYPNDLKPVTEKIIGEAVRKFPVQTQNLQLCRHVVSELTPHLCAKVQHETLRGDLALSAMRDLLHHLLACNCDSEEMSRLKQETRKSDEWLKFADEIARVTSATENGGERTDRRATAGVPRPSAEEHVKIRTEEEVWLQIDHRLVSLKLQQVAKRRERETQTKRKAIYWRNRDNKNAAIIPLQLFQLELEQMRKWATGVYRVYNEVWQTQGEKKTPEFVRVVFGKSIIPLINARIGCTRDFIENHAARTAMGRGQLAALLDELDREAARLQDEWRQKTEIEATKLDYEKKRRTKRRAHKRRMRRRMKRKPPGRVPLPAEKRASTVAKIIKELDVLKPQMYGASDYEALAQRYPRFLTFRVADKRPDLKEKVVNVQEHRRHIRLAQEIAAASYGRELSTVQTDWKKHKPKRFRWKLP